jgi:hypothetical protein
MVARKFLRMMDHPEHEIVEIGNDFQFLGHVRHRVAIYVLYRPGASPLDAKG